MSAPRRDIDIFKSANEADSLTATSGSAIFSQRISIVCAFFMFFLDCWARDIDAMADAACSRTELSSSSSKAVHDSIMPALTAFLLSLLGY